MAAWVYHTPWRLSSCRLPLCFTFAVWTIWDQYFCRVEWVYLPNPTDKSRLHRGLCGLRSWMKIQVIRPSGMYVDGDGDGDGCGYTRTHALATQNTKHKTQTQNQSRPKCPTHLTGLGRTAARAGRQGDYYLGGNFRDRPVRGWALLLSWLLLACKVAVGRSGRLATRASDAGTWHVPSMRVGRLAATTLASSSFQHARPHGQGDPGGSRGIQGYPGGSAHGGMEKGTDSSRDRDRICESETGWHYLLFMVIREQTHSTRASASAGHHLMRHIPCHVRWSVGMSHSVNEAPTPTKTRRAGGGLTRRGAPVIVIFPYSSANLSLEMPSNS
jgi:hypothetical protein